MNEHHAFLDGLEEFVDFSKEVETPTGENLEKIHLRTNDYRAIIGYKVLKDFARFTSHEDLSIDTLEYYGKTRIYLTGLKRRAVYRRSSEAILRQYNAAYNCATPDHQCMHCYNCYLYGGVIAIADKTKAIKSRMKTTTSFSIQSDEESIIDEPEFHTMIHRDLKMAQTTDQKKASIYEMVLIKPGVVFPFIDIIFNPTKFDMAMYFETVRRSDAEGYGSRSSLLGTMDTSYVAVTDDLRISQVELLDALKIEEARIEDSRLKELFNPNELIQKKEIEELQHSLPGFIETNKNAIYGT